MINSTREAIKTGVFITFVEKYSNVVIQIATTAILARILSPNEFGVIAVVMVFVIFFGLLTEMGIGPAIIQRQDLDVADISIIFNFTFAIGFIFSILFYLTANWIAIFYNDQIYITIVHYLSIVVLFSTLSIVPRAMLVKNKMFDTLAKINISINLFASVIAIFLAHIGFSYYAILIRAIFSSIFIFITMFFVSGLKINKTLRLDVLKKIYKFAMYQFAFNFINYFTRNLDNLLIGKYFGTQLLGLYDKAYTLMLLPVNNLTHVLTPVLQTSLAKYQDDYVFVYDTYLKLVKILALLGVPISVIFYFNAYELIYLFFGEQWLGVVSVFKILSVSIWIQVILSSSGSIFQVVNRTDLLFLSGIISMFIILPMLIIGMTFGNLESIASSLIWAFLFNFVQTYYFLIIKALKADIWAFCKVLIKPVMTGLIMLIGMSIISFQANSVLLSLSVKIGLSLIIYFICTYMMKELEPLIKILKRS